MQSKRLLFLCCFLLAAALLGAQTGAISGLITDSDQGAGLPGASIFLKDNPGVGTVSEIDGNFNLPNIPVGEQTVVISYVGFQNEERTVTVTEGGNAEIAVTLGGGVVFGQEVLVTGQALGQAKAINQQLNSDGVANFVSADKIKELPDVNAAEAISRLPGVAINRSGGEGSKVVVRGLDPKFTTININGVRLPSTSGNDRSVDLSLISPELLSGIELFKSPTPDMDGDALGGAVNLNIIKADDRPRASLKARGGYNDLVGQARDYQFTGSLSRRVFDDKLGIIATANVERYNRSGRIVGQSWRDNFNDIIDTARQVFGQLGNSLNLQHREEIRRRYNASLGLDYSFGKNTDVTLLGIFSRTTRDQFTHSEGFGAENGGFGARPGIRETGTSLYSGSISTRHRLNFMSIEWGVSYSETVGKTPLDIDFDFRGPPSGVLLPGAIDVRNTPGRLYDFVDLSPAGVALFGSSSTESGNQEDITTAFVDLKIPFNLGDNWRGEFKFGGKFRGNNKSREFTEFNDKLYYLRPIGVWDELLPGGVVGATGQDPSTYLGVANFLVEGNADLPLRDNLGRDVGLFLQFDESILRRFDELFRGQYPQDFFGITNNFNLSEDMFAAYAMFKFKLGEQLTIIPGFRYEGNNNDYTGIVADLVGDWGEEGPRTPRSTEADYGEFLPHLHLKYKPIDWFDVRASYSTTLARPDFNYVVPASLVNRNGDNVTIRQGNPLLGPQTSTNYDLYLTAFSGKFGLISVGGFYKDIQDAFYPINLGVNSDSIALANGLEGPGWIGSLLTSFGSSPDSEVYGLEFDLQSNLNFLPKPFNNMVFNLNYARLFSNTTISNFREETSCRRVGRRVICTTETFGFEREAALIGQAEHILNTSLGYDVGGLSLRVSAAYQGTKITGYSASADKDRFDREFWRMDAAIKYRFSRRLNVFLNLNNLTNQQDVTFFRTESLETSRATFGTTGQIGVEVKFLPKEER